MTRIKSKKKQRKRATRARNRHMTGEKIRFDAKALRRIPLPERTLLLGLWHATNELNALRKLILLVNNNRTKGPIEGSAKALTGLLFVKIFAVKATEAWGFFKKAQNFPEFREKYLAHEVSPDLIASKDWLGSYFGKSNILQKVRDKFGAHYDLESVSKGAEDLDGLDSYIFLTDHQGNSLYWVAEELQLRSLLEPGQKFGPIYSKMLDDVSDVAAKITTLAQLISVIAIEASDNRKAFRLSLTHRVRSRIYETADIPFFVDFSAFLNE